MPHPRSYTDSQVLFQHIDENHDGRVTGQELTAWLQRWAHDGDVVEAAAGPAEERDPVRETTSAPFARRKKDKTPTPSTVHEFWNLHSEEVVRATRAADVLRLSADPAGEAGTPRVACEWPNPLGRCRRLPHVHRRARQREW